MKELDVLLERYVRSHLADASGEQRAVLGQLLELPDPLLADYLFGHARSPEAQLAGLIAAIRTCESQGEARIPALKNCEENAGGSPELS